MWSHPSSLLAPAPLGQSTHRGFGQMLAKRHRPEISLLLLLCPQFKSYLLFQSSFCSAWEAHSHNLAGRDKNEGAILHLDGKQQSDQATGSAITVTLAGSGLAKSIQQGAIWRGVLAALAGVSVLYFKCRVGAMCWEHRLQVGFRPPQAQAGPGVTMAITEASLRPMRLPVGSALSCKSLTFTVSFGWVVGLFLHFSICSMPLGGEVATASLFHAISIAGVRILGC